MGNLKITKDGNRAVRVYDKYSTIIFLLKVSGGVCKFREMIIKL